MGRNQRNKMEGCERWKTEQLEIRDEIHMTSMKIVQFSRPLTSLVHLRPTFLHPLDLGRPISNEPSPPFPNDNQSVKRKQFKDDYYMLSGTSFWSAFVFIINSLILSGFSLASFI